MEQEQLLTRVCEMVRGGVIPLTALQTMIDEYDPMILIDRAIMSEYPYWVRDKLYPKLDKIGPASFNVSKLELWLHPKQFKGVVKGNEIHEYLKNRGLLKSCLGLPDLLAIQKRGITFFRKHFAGKAVFAWKSVVRDHDGILNVPCLVESLDDVVIRWRWLVNDWDFSFSTLRFISQSSAIEF